VRRRLIALALAVTASAAAVVGVAYGSSVPWSQQDRELLQACVATRTSVVNAMSQAASAPSRTIESSMDVVTPLVLWGRIYFGSAGKVTVNGVSFAGCTQRAARARALGPEPARVVSELQQTFTTAGRHVLKFTLNRLGQKLMAQLGAAQRAYRQRHPRGHDLPQIAVSVALGYTPTG
jgi:hypothetical protein